MRDPDQIMTAAEWMRRPTWHGSYDDYVSHMRGIRRAAEVYCYACAWRGPREDLEHDRVFKADCCPDCGTAIEEDDA